MRMDNNNRQLSWVDVVSIIIAISIYHFSADCNLTHPFTQLWNKVLGMRPF